MRFILASFIPRALLYLFKSTGAFSKQESAECLTQKRNLLELSKGKGFNLVNFEQNKFSHRDVTAPVRV